MPPSMSIWELIGHALAASLTLRVGLAAFSAIALHEIGHMVAGRLTGAVIESVAIGEGRRLFGWRLGSIQYSLHALPIGGYVEHARYPGSPAGALLFAAGGIFVNLAVGLACVGLLLAARLPDWAVSLIWIMAPVHLGLAALNLIPRHVDGCKTDGLLMLEAWRNIGLQRRDA